LSQGNKMREQVPPVLFWTRVFLNARRLQRQQAEEAQAARDKERLRQVGAPIRHIAPQLQPAQPVSVCG
jgi:hypothetical protein